MAQLVLDKVAKTYAGNVLGVEDVNLEVQDRELVVIVGPSGCGKTTILRLIAGLEDVTRGEIRLGAVVLNRRAPQDRDVALVFQDYALYPHLTVRGNMAFGLKMRRGAGRLAAGEINRRVVEAAGVLRLSHLLERKPRQLSGGERQRVAFGRAMVREPAVFLFDEPLSGLDLPLRVELRREILALRQRVVAPMLYVTHDQSEAANMADRTVMLYGGRVQQVGRWLELYDYPVNMTVARFIGTPPMNLWNGTIEWDGSVAVFRAGTVKLPLPREMAERVRSLPRDAVTIGLRPDSIRCRPISSSPGRPLIARVLGFERYESGGVVRVQMDGESLVCAGEWLQRDEMVELVFDMTRCHLFDWLGRNVATGIEKSSPGG